MQFADLRLIEPLLRSLVSEGYTTATPIQAKAIPSVLEGKDVMGSAQTGTGKTAAFALPILQRLSQNAPAHSGAATPRIRCLVLCPTRELATQIGDGFRAYGKNLKLRHTVIFGGVSQHGQVEVLRRGCPEIVIATPGRLLDLIEQRYVDLRSLEVLVLDEADRMLDMGFIRDIRKIVQHVPPKRQTLMFSATMPDEIRRLAHDLLRDPVTVEVAPVATTADKIDQSVYFVEKGQKPQLLAHLVNALPMSRAIVFTRTKHGADKVVRHLHARGIRAEAIHGNKSQNNRTRALDGFKSGKVPVLVATDIASRGIDVENITHVVNYDLTHEPETYVHRIGRTARAGASGHAVSFCASDERENLRLIEKLIRRSIPVKTDHPEYVASYSTPEMQQSRPAGVGGRQQHVGGGGVRHAQASQQNGARHAAASSSQQQNGAARPHRNGGQQQPAQGGGGARPHHNGGRPQHHASSSSARPEHRTGGRGAAAAGQRPLHPTKGKPGRGAAAAAARPTGRRGPARQRRGF
ncbi:MAG TPA: DEAD/DEAH box helicase [Tepidisphaeraceae bacterium]|nr:DEAD/DEAH box helicase [Tepidisphaeraceae bacterium]